MFEKFSVIQCHAPHGVASMYFGGITYRFEGNYPETNIKEFLLGTSAKDKIYTIPFTLKQAISQAKQFSTKLIVNMNEVIKKDIPLVSPELFGKVAGIIADILVENGFTNKTVAIALINEPKERWHLTESDYIPYVLLANKYVKGRFYLIIINEEYHKFDERLIIPKIKDLKIMWGVHHLGSLGKNPTWKNIEYAKTQADEWGVPICCNEGGSWFKNYQSEEGHAINVKLIEECKDKKYKFVSVCMPELNEEGHKIYPNLGYRIWNNNYTILKSTTNWDKFEKEIKKYQKGGEPMPPEDRLIYYKVPNMTGKDVKEIEIKLRSLGFDVLLDSKFTMNDKKSVEVFQELAHVVKDGIIGEQTRGKLDSINSDTFYPEVFKPIWDKKDYSIEVIDYFLSEKAHPNLHGCGKWFKQAETETGIPVEWMLASAMQESGEENSTGVFLIGQSYYGREWKNIYGWAIYDSGPQPAGKFETYKDCILTVPKEIKRLYLEPNSPHNNGEHIFGIEVKYSTAGHNAIRKAQYYRYICQFMDLGIRHKMPEYVEDLVPILDKYFIRKEE